MLFACVSACFTLRPTVREEDAPRRCVDALVRGVDQRQAGGGSGGGGGGGVGVEKAAPNIEIALRCPVERWL